MITTSKDLLYDKSDAEIGTAWKIGLKLWRDFKREALKDWLAFCFVGWLSIRSKVVDLLDENEGFLKNLIGLTMR